MPGRGGEGTVGEATGSDDAAEPRSTALDCEWCARFAFVPSKSARDRASVSRALRPSRRGDASSALFRASTGPSTDPSAPGACPSPRSRATRLASRARALLCSSRSSPLPPPAAASSASCVSAPRSAGDASPSPTAPRAPATPSPPRFSLFSPTALSFVFPSAVSSRVFAFDSRSIPGDESAPVASAPSRALLVSRSPPIPFRAFVRCPSTFLHSAALTCRSTAGQSALGDRGGLSSVRPRSAVSGATSAASSRTIASDPTRAREKEGEGIGEGMGEGVVASEPDWSERGQASEATKGARGEGEGEGAEKGRGLCGDGGHSWSLALLSATRGDGESARRWAFPGLGKAPVLFPPAPCVSSCAGNGARFFGVSPLLSPSTSSASSPLPAPSLCPWLSVSALLSLRRARATRSGVASRSTRTRLRLLRRSTTWTSSSTAQLECRRGGAGNAGAGAGGARIDGGGGKEKRSEEHKAIMAPSQVHSSGRAVPGDAEAEEEERKPGDGREAVGRARPVDDAQRQAGSGGKEEHAESPTSGGGGRPSRDHSERDAREGDAGACSGEDAHAPGSRRLRAKSAPAGRRGGGVRRNEGTVRSGSQTSSRSCQIPSAADRSPCTQPSYDQHPSEARSHAPRRRLGREAAFS